VGALAALREEMVATHVEAFGDDRDLLVSLQLTHSGRFARPHVHERPEPLVAYNHPVLDRRFAGGVRVLSDDELDRLVGDFVRAGRLAQQAGFPFVDVKHCHGYLGHELLSARERPGRYGGSFENRTRFLREVVAGLRAEAPGLRVMVRLSCFDTVPWRKEPDGSGHPEAVHGYRSAFGLLEDDLDRALADAREMLRLFESLDIRWVCVTAGSPYYNPHVQRPALFPPLDGYNPPEDPLRGVARHLQATALLKKAFPGIAVVGSCYSYLHEWLPHVGQRVLREGGADFVGLGRMVLSYPELPADVLAGRPLRRKAICRTFSDCTTAPRSGLVSGCYPLDPFYTAYPQAADLKRVKEALRA
jgi:2,4-dienoyl-CoA reductase-like NADH-dependent reductase (Old Yellow Enzyme family)